jgi:hypothetical protein
MWSPINSCGGGAFPRIHSKSNPIVVSGRGSSDMIAGLSFTSVEAMWWVSDTKHASPHDDFLILSTISPLFNSI